MKSYSLSGFLFAVLFILCAAAPCHAYMTLFNDTGSWQLVIVKNDEDEKRIYRICKNSKDRHKNVRSDGSLAIVCVTIIPDDKKASLGIWHSDDLGISDESIPCAITWDGHAPKQEFCRILPTIFGKSNVILTEDNKQISAILSHENFAVLLGDSKNAGSLQPLEFGTDIGELKQVIEPVREYFDFILN